MKLKKRFKLFNQKIILSSSSTAYIKSINFKKIISYKSINKS